MCGDGVATGGEECDGMDLQGMTCADLTQEYMGTLQCSSNCSFDISACGSTGSCPNGILEFGEMCDCGTDPATLPEGCTDAGGGPDANCTVNCTTIDLCGDGIVSSDEQCDCGWSPDLKPADCSDLNGAPGGECGDTCQWSHGDCDAELWDQCNTSSDTCCPDDWGRTTVCVTVNLEGDAYCLRECNTTLDCFWSNSCEAQSGGFCLPARCEAGTVGSFCEVEGGGSGWCAPVFNRTDPDDVQYGVCVESGILQHGEQCQPHPDLLYNDRTVPACETGLCLQTLDSSVGVCRQLCDWESAYEAAIYGLSGEILPCPTGANCLNTARLDASTGVRTGDVAYCVERGPLDHPLSATTCSLVSGQLLADPASTCADELPNGRCHLVVLPSGEAANGTLVGVCAATSTPNRVVWEICDPNTDTCAQGARCHAQDFFAPNPAGPMRCVPLCDARFHTDTSDCAALGAGDPTATCRSLSERFAPTDLSPTRLGLCALP